MILLADNNRNVVLDDRLIEFERIIAKPDFIIYNQFLKQLHLPAEKWEFDKSNPGYLLVEHASQLTELDAILFKDLEYSKLASPLRLYQYNLLQLLLGNGLNFRGIGLIGERKTRFLFLYVPFECNANYFFEHNELSRFILKRAKPKDLLSVHESFFVLLNEKFKEKLLNALTLYQSETGDHINKSEWINAVLDPKRLFDLHQFSERLINRI